MSIDQNAVLSANLPAKWAGASVDVVKAIRSASSRTGVSFDYLMDKAKTESAFKTDIKAKTSSATGLFQFIDSTWLQAMKDHGEKLGLGDLVKRIEGGDQSAKREALELRKDPEVAATITAEATKQNQYYLETSVGGKIGENELYLAHFLGLGGATKFLQAQHQNPNAPAADLFPAAAKANKNVFFEASGKKRSLNDVYAFFDKKMGGVGDNSVVTASAQTNDIAKPMSPVFAQVQKPVAPVAIDHDMMARLAGVNKHDAMTASFDYQRNFMDLALRSFGSQDEDRSNDTLHEGKLLAPLTAMLLAKMGVAGEPTETDKKDLS